MNMTWIMANSVVSVKIESPTGFTYLFTVIPISVVFSQLFMSSLGVKVISARLTGYYIFINL